MRKVIVVGGGAAGLMAAVSAAQNGAEVMLLEKNNRLGKKLLITGKGRCNVTNTAPLQEFVKNIPGNGRFLYSVFSKFFNWDIRSFFEELDVPLKEERGGRIFPVSDKAIDIVNAFEKANDIKIKYEFGPRRAGDLPQFWANAQKAQDVLGWKTTRTLEDMCRDTWNWQKNNPNGYAK